MKIRVSTIAVTLIATMTGCASNPSYKVQDFWKKSDVSYKQATQDFYSCKEKAKSTAERETQIGGLTESCMTLNGYKWGQYKTRIE